MYMSTSDLLEIFILIFIFAKTKRCSKKGTAIPFYKHQNFCKLNYCSFILYLIWSSVKFSDKIFESILPWLRSPLM